MSPFPMRPAIMAPPPAGERRWPDYSFTNEVREEICRGCGEIIPAGRPVHIGHATNPDRISGQCCSWSCAAAVLAQPVERYP